MNWSVIAPSLVSLVVGYIIHYFQSTGAAPVSVAPTAVPTAPSVAPAASSQSSILSSLSSLLPLPAASLSQLLAQTTPATSTSSGRPVLDALASIAQSAITAEAPSMGPLATVVINAELAAVSSALSQLGSTTPAPAKK